MGRSTTERGLGGHHQRLRRALLPQAYGKPCAICGRLMTQDQPLDLDHIVPRALGGSGGPVRIVHAVCNRRQGGRLGRMMVVDPRRRVRSRW